MLVSRVILNTDTRAKLYDVVFRLASKDYDELHGVLNLLNRLVPFYEDEDGTCFSTQNLAYVADNWPQDEPYLYDLPQQFDRFKAIRSPCGYAGLRNLSNTCYLNSLLTQLYMNANFRQFILSVNTEDPSDTQELLFHTQNVFGFLQESYRRYVDPIAFVSAIKTYDDTMIDIYIKWTSMSSTTYFSTVGKASFLWPKIARSSGPSTVGSWYSKLNPRSASTSRRGSNRFRQSNATSKGTAHWKRACRHMWAAKSWMAVRDY